MQIESSFRMDVPVDEAWTVLLDLERIVRNLPGAQLQEIAGHELRGTLTVEVGPIAAEYRGTTHIESSDASSRTAVVVASGHEPDGKGDAAATIKAVLRADGPGTRIDVEADLVVTGQIADLEGTAIGDAWTNRLGLLVGNLEQDALRPDVVDLTGADDEPAAATPDDVTDDVESDELVAEAVATSAEPAASPSGNGAAVLRDEPAAGAPVEVIEPGGAPALRRLAPLAGVAVAVLLVRWLVRRRRGSGL